MLNLRKIDSNNVKLDRMMNFLKAKGFDFTVGFPDFNEKWVIVTVPAIGWKGGVLLKDMMNIMLPSGKGMALTPYFEKKIISMINDLKSVPLFSICGYSNNELHLTCASEPPFSENTKMICVNDNSCCVWLLELPVNRFPVNSTVTKLGLKWKLDFLKGYTVVDYSLLHQITSGDILLIKYVVNKIHCSSICIGTYNNQKDGIIMDNVEMKNAPEDTNEFFNIHDDLKQLPIKLEFVLHSQNFTYDEISRFFDKEILSLPLDAEKKIRINANGMAIGVGELVQVNDHLGVQIMQWPGNKNVAE